MQHATNAAPLAFRTCAAFLVAGVWIWKTWTHTSGNKHEAIIAKRDELGATGCDFGNAEHEEEPRWNYQTRG